MDANRFANKIVSFLNLALSTPPYAVIAWALVNKVGTNGAYVDPNGNRIIPGGVAIGGAAGGVWPASAQGPAPKVANPRHSAGRVDFKANESMRSR